jgi:hypothetical protein
MRDPIDHHAPDHVLFRATRLHDDLDGWVSPPILADHTFSQTAGHRTEVTQSQVASSAFRQGSCDGSGVVGVPDDSLRLDQKGLAFRL